jgi:hypothetical protein
MLFAMMLGLVLGAAAVLLIEQWLRGELRAFRDPSNSPPRRLRGGGRLGSRSRPVALPSMSRPSMSRRTLF